MLIPPLRCVLRSLRSSSSARWFPRCGAVVVIAELFAAVAAGDTVAVLLFGPLFRHAVVTVPQMFATAAAGDTVVVLLFSSFILLSVAGFLFLECCCFFCPLFSSGDWTATVTALQSGRSPHAGARPLTVRGTARRSLIDIRLDGTPTTVSSNPRSCMKAAWPC